MFCSKCGNKLESDAQFCSMCGNKIENELPAENLEKMNAETVLPAKNNKTKISLVVVFALVIAIIVFFIFYIHNVNKEHSDESNNSTYQTANSTNSAEFSIENSMLQSNLSNWSMACVVDGDVFYSDVETGIYIKSSNNQFATGIYSDLCCVDNKLVCVENYYVQTSDKTHTEFGRIVVFDVHTKEKKVLFSQQNEDDYIAINNVIDKKIYFTLSDNTLWTSDLSGNVTNTGISNVCKVTPSGVYTHITSEKGLKLVSFNNKEIKTFEKLTDYTVGFYFELNGKVYAKISNEDAYNNYIIIDINSGEFTFLKNQNEYGQMTNWNFKDNTLFCSFVKKDDDYSPLMIYESKLDGSNMKYLASIDRKDDYMQFYSSITVLNEDLYISFPYSKIESQFIKIK